MAIYSNIDNNQGVVNASDQMGHPQVNLNKNIFIYVTECIGRPEFGI